VSKSVAPKLSIEVVGHKSEKVTRIRVTFGPDRHYDLTILIDPAITPDSVRRDGKYRPGAHFRIGGLDDSADCEERTVFRAFGESELRWIGKACQAAATALRVAERNQ
jgi:hypothetical protein